MNAYELADELDKINDIPIETIINMLRQQADRIAELEADVEKKLVMIGLWEAKFKELAEATGFAGYLAGMMVFEDKTPQIKELSDEEILKIIKKHEAINGNIDTYDVLACVKAILKKANFTCNGFCGKQECKENQDSCKRIKKASEK